jgi:transposase
MRPKGSPEELERRRRRAMILLEQDLSLNEVARRLGCNASSVKRWRDALQQGGGEALQPKPTPGRPPRLTGKQKERLVRYLLQGAPSHGYRTDLWTTQRIAELVERKFGVKYHRDHIGRLMHSLSWSHQKPERRAVECDEEEVERWKREDWPRIKKRPRGWAPTSSLLTNRASS